MLDGNPMATGILDSLEEFTQASMMGSRRRVFPGQVDTAEVMTESKLCCC
jgi:hypothetical protein